MTKNMGVVDRTVRILIAVVLAVLYFNGTITGWVGGLALLIAIVFLLTSVIGFCPLYVPLKLTTLKK